MQGIEEFNYNITTGSGKARVGTNQASGSLVINNGATSTIRGEVSSGKIEIEN
jgi:formylmethanofuran dehydrogenase subunit C